MPKIKELLLITLLFLTTIHCFACKIVIYDGVNGIVIKESSVQGIPKSNSIQATIDGHLLSVVFLENLGEVTVEVTTVTGWEVETSAIHTPNGVNFYIPNTGSYIVTFTLPDGDEYYGEFEVTD